MPIQAIFSVERIHREILRREILRRNLIQGLKTSTLFSIINQ